MNTHCEPGTRDCRHRRAPATGRMRLPLILLLALGAVQMGWRHLQSSADAPTRSQRIYAMLVEWGAETSGLSPPVSQAEIDQRTAQLWTQDSETRVLAAQWLADRGVRRAGDQIAAAMRDPGTLRPCQLAHSLGHLGDERWVDELVAAAGQTRNTDLRVCATMGLRSLASDRAGEALLELARSGEAPTTAIEALGIIGDADALPLLRDVARSDAGALRRAAAETAIRRIEIFNSADPIPALLDHLDESLRRGRADEWALRTLARRGDARAAEHLAFLLRQAENPAPDSERRAAALLALGESGRQALVEIAATDSRRHSVAREALSLLTSAAIDFSAGDASR